MSVLVTCPQELGSWLVREAAMDEKYDVIVLGTGLKVCPFSVVSIVK